MADDVDLAQAQNELADRLALQYRKPVMRIAPIGRCHWCDQDFNDGSLKLFCDSDCATRHHRYHGGMR